MKDKENGTEMTKYHVHALIERWTSSCKGRKSKKGSIAFSDLETCGIALQLCGAFSGWDFVVGNANWVEAVKCGGLAH
jgi:hypothetical protein